MYTMENELELQRVNQVCLPSWVGRINSVILRPERPKYAIRMGLPPNENWIRVLRRLRQVKLCADMQKAASYASTEPLPLCQFLDRTSMFLPYAIGLTAALQFTAAILYDQECTGSVRDLKEPCPGNAEEAEKRCSISQVSSFWDHNMQQEIIVPLFEHMLLIDACPENKNADNRPFCNTTDNIQKSLSPIAFVISQSTLRLSSIFA